MRLWRCRDGASAVEFALIALPFLIAIIGVIEVAMILFINVLMEGGVRDSARFGITGYSPTGTDRETEIRRIVLDRLMAGPGKLWIDSNKLTITTLVYSSFSDIGKPEPYTDLEPKNGAYDVGEPFVDINGNGQWDADMGKSGAGEAGDIVLYTVTYNWPIMTQLMAPLLGDAGYFPIRTSVAVRNEPFPEVAAGGG